jgi:cobalamin biosynthesis protein CobD/CbiB
VTIAEGNTLDEQIAADERRAKILRRIEQLEKQARTEKQPCRKWELAAEAKKLKIQLEGHT